MFCVCLIVINLFFRKEKKAEKCVLNTVSFFLEKLRLIFVLFLTVTTRVEK